MPCALNMARTALALACVAKAPRVPSADRISRGVAANKLTDEPKSVAANGPVARRAAALQPVGNEARHGESSSRACAGRAVGGPLPRTASRGRVRRRGRGRGGGATASRGRVRGAVGARRRRRHREAERGAACAVGARCCKYGRRKTRVVEGAVAPLARAQRREEDDQEVVAGEVAPGAGVRVVEAGRRPRT